MNRTVEFKLIGTGRTPSEQDLLDMYLLSFITIREYLERLSTVPHKEEKDVRS